ncbi:MAG TPA: transcription-repair coupling factor [Actinomycetota bacterium]|nr:transcription-repair coupling factor [Actinomycetota bacterium]
MADTALKSLVEASPALDEASSTLLENGILTVVDPARALVLANLARAGDSWLVVVPTLRDAERLVAELRAFTDAVAMFPPWETLPHERLSPRPETVARRLEALRRARTGEARIVIAPVLAAMQHMVPGAQDIEPVIVKQGESHDPEILVRDLVRLDYHRTELVERRGELAVRGGLLDVFPPTSDHPIRIEFFGDEVESMRAFAVASQRSLDHVDRMEAYPCRELLPTDEVRGRAIAAIEKHPSERLELNRLADGMTFEGVEALIDSLWDEPPVLRNALPADTRVLVVDPKRTDDRAHELMREVEELREAAWSSAGEGGRAPASGGLADPDTALGEQRARITPFRGDNPILEASVWDVARGDVDKMVSAAKQLMRDGIRVIATAATTGQADRVREVLRNKDIAVEFLEERAPQPGQTAVAVAAIEEGFWSPALGLALIGESDLFGKRRAHREPKATRRSVTPLDLIEGDLVVHVVHGVGRYRGMETREIGGSVNDYLTLEYAEGDKLFVPADQVDAVSKYIGGEAPKLNRLGTGDWNRQKAKVRKAVRDMAGELIQLYSARASSRGFAFSPDQPWQRELEDAFPYVETKDQLSAIDDVKSDMEKPVPMDRLICGDVGFGKTEIAIRAAFKAVLDGKQVAVLVPTTLLAQQHYATFTERYAPFPVRVVMLSRFVTAKEQARVLEEIASGKVDVVIGTHRLLQKDVLFADLGLLVVDEEQRFGVAHKERLKQLKTSVDVLTMTATPIPRTLEMSMGGIRDMSVIDTPPEDRHPVLTFVGEASEETKARAIRREMLREGQTFYVHNQVNDIDLVAGHIREMVPEARVGVAHGQMEERRLERVMLDFWDRQYDVLVTTTIIESGLDIPTANTLVVDRADALGLSQLYQLRGRVGRSHERAYAYFLYPGDRSLSEQSHARLNAIGQLTDLGSGLQIALRDLEIRGAGNLLGAEQSGHIATVGFDLYVRLLAEAVDEARGKRLEPKPEVKVDLPVDAHLPESWIAREGLRLEAYRRIAEADNMEALADVRTELRDRYGELPTQAEELLTVAELRFVLGRRGVRTIQYLNGQIRIEPLVLAESEKVRLQRLFKGSIFKPVTFTALVPVPRDPEGGVARWLLGAAKELLSED